jgi:hypothetical protein
VCRFDESYMTEVFVLTIQTIQLVAINYAKAYR